MRSPRYRISLLTLITFFAGILISVFVMSRFYDHHQLLTRIDPYLFGETKKSPVLNEYVINIESRIPSRTFLETLFLLRDESADSVLIDINFNRLSDTQSIGMVEKAVNDDKNIFQYLINKKEKYIFIPFFSTENEPESNKDFLFLKTANSFFLASLGNQPAFENPFKIPPERIGIVTSIDNPNDRQNIHLLYKINQKYLFSMSALLHASSRKVNLPAVEFLTWKTGDPGTLFYYDEKGKASYVYNQPAPSPSVKNFIEWNKALDTRSLILANMIKLSLYPENITGESYADFRKQEEAIDRIYETPPFGDAEKNSLLSVTKNKVSEWKSFRSAIKPMIHKKPVIICQNGEFQWISRYLQERMMMNDGIQLKRIPAAFWYPVLLLLFSLILISGVFFRKTYVPVLITVFFLLLSAGGYFFLRIFFKTDLPVFGWIAMILAACIFGITLRRINKVIWQNHVFKVFKAFISPRMSREIAVLWEAGKWTPEQAQHIASFLATDTSCFLHKELSEDEIDTIGFKTAEIENTIREHKGIISNINTNLIYSYFGNPPILKNPVEESIETALQIQTIPIVIDGQVETLHQAIHIKKEWFKLVTKDGLHYYTHFGNALNILTGMLRYASRFKIGIVISDTVFRIMKSKLPVRLYDRVRIQGLKSPIRLLELLNSKQELELQPILDYYHAGIKLFESKKWTEAAAYFKQCLKIREKDIPSKIYLERCKEFSYAPPYEDWDMTYEIENLK